MTASTETTGDPLVVAEYAQCAILNVLAGDVRQNLIELCAALIGS